jgi:hypothetical protein
MFTHIHLAPSGDRALFYVVRPPPTPSVSVDGETYLGPTINDLYIADGERNEVLYVGQVFGGISQVLWRPDDAEVLVTTLGLSGQSTESWEFAPTTLPPIQPFTPNSGYPIAFSPNGQYLLFAESANLWIRHLAGHVDTQLPIETGPGDVWWLPDSSGFFALDRREPSLSRLVLYRPAYSQLSTLSPPIEDLYPWVLRPATLSADFQILAYLASTDPPYGGPPRLALAYLCPH